MQNKIPDFPTPSCEQPETFFCQMSNDKWGLVVGKKCEQLFVLSPHMRIVYIAHCSSTALLRRGDPNWENVQDKWKRALNCAY
jgi:hypothetical protein